MLRPLLTIADTTTAGAGYADVFVPLARREGQVLGFNPVADSNLYLSYTTPGVGDLGKRASGMLKRAGFEVRTLVTPPDDELNSLAYREMSWAVMDLRREVHMRQRFGTWTDPIVLHIVCAGEGACELHGCYDDDDDVLLAASGLTTSSALGEVMLDGAAQGIHVIFEERITGQPHSATHSGWVPMIGLAVKEEGGRATASWTRLSDGGGPYREEDYGEVVLDV